MNSFEKEITSEKINEAVDCLRKVFPATTLERSEYLSEVYGGDIYLKREDETPVRSYKIRGAYYFISEYLKNNSTQPVFACASAGNHAQGVALSCAKFKTKGVIFMPQTTPKQKITRTKIFGEEFIEIRLVGDTFEHSQQEALKFSEENQAVFIPPFNHPLIVTGQATVGVEILDQLTPDYVIAPVGGGGLTSGLCLWFEKNSPETKIVGVEPAGAPSLHDSLKRKERIKLEKTNQFVDGASVDQIGELNWEILKDRIDPFLPLIPENRLCQTIINFLTHEGLIIEPAGALAIDALQDFPPGSFRGKKVVCIVSGGNFDFDRLSDVKERAMRFGGKKKYWILQLPQRPGALREFLSCLGPDDDISRFEYLKKSVRSFGSVLIGIESVNLENFVEIERKVGEAGFVFQDITDNQLLSDFLV